MFSHIGRGLSFLRMSFSIVQRRVILFTTLNRRGPMTTEVTYADINGTLGSLLRLWAAIERQARHEVRHGQTRRAARSPHGIAATLNAWETFVLETTEVGSLRAALSQTLRAQLQPHLAMRNGLCHGLIGTTAGRGGPGASLTWELNDERHSVTWEELQHNFKWLSKVPHAMSILSQPIDAGLGSRLKGSAENLQWWLDEFDLGIGIDVQFPRSMPNL
jgi:hypothetical protein